MTAALILSAAGFGFDIWSVSLGFVAGFAVASALEIYRRVTDYRRKWGSWPWEGE